MQDAKTSVEQVQKPSSFCFMMPDSPHRNGEGRNVSKTNDSARGLGYLSPLEFEPRIGGPSGTSIELFAASHLWHEQHVSCNSKDAQEAL